MVVTTRATRALEEIVAELTGPWWYQVYVIRERRMTEGLVRRAAGLGASALVFTVDLPYVGFKRRGHSAPVSRDEHLVNFGTHVPTRLHRRGDRRRHGAGHVDRARDDRLAA